MSTQTIETEARKHLDALGYSQFQLVCKQKGTTHALEAHIHNHTFEITIEHDPTWQEKFNQARALHIEQVTQPQKRGLLSRLFGLSKTSEESPRVDHTTIYGDAWDVLRTVTYHEHGHWRYCPFDIEHLETILDATSKGLKAAGLDEQKVKAYTAGKANEFSDIIVNSALAIDHPDTRKGRATKYLREAFSEDEILPSMDTGYRAAGRRARTDHEESIAPRASSYICCLLSA